MTEEELQAFKKLQEIKLDYHSEYWKLDRKTDKEMEKWADTLIQLIKKQQKEIEKLNKYALEDLKDLNNYIPKHKIREKIKEVDKLYDNAETDEFGIKSFYGYDFIMDMLKELLGEEKNVKN